jgi:hypothetical protein
LCDLSSVGVHHVHFQLTVAAGHKHFLAAIGAKMSGSPGYPDRLNRAIGHE